jgi:hypothetical protein
LFCTMFMNTYLPFVQDISSYLTIAKSGLTLTFLIGCGLSKYSHQ